MARREEMCLYIFFFTNTGFSELGLKKNVFEIEGLKTCMKYELFKYIVNIFFSRD